MASHDQGPSSGANDDLRQDQQEAANSTSAASNTLSAVKEAQERRHAERDAIREKNLAASKPGGRPNRDFFKQLDSSVKKNTAFVKKLKTSLIEGQQASLLSDASKLNLGKYIPEVVSAMVQDAARSKKADVQTAVHLACLLHQRYDEFAPEMEQALSGALATVPGIDDKDGIHSYRFFLRLFAELLLLRVLDDEHVRTFGKRLQQLCEKDRDHDYIAIITSICKSCGEELCGFVSRKNRMLAQDTGETFVAKPVFPQRAPTFQQLFSRYFEGAAKHLVKLKKELNKRLQKDEYTMQMKGELSQERQDATSTLRRDFENLHANVLALAEVIDADMPDMPEPERSDELEAMNIDISNPFKSMDPSELGGGIWEDADAQDFYENLLDLRATVPAVLFETKKKGKGKNEQAEDDAGDAAPGTDVGGHESTGDGAASAKADTADAGADKIDVEDEEKLRAELSHLDTNEDAESADAAAQALLSAEIGGDDAEADAKYEADDDGDAKTSATMDLESLDKMGMLLQRLPSCVNRQLIDDWAVEFCYLNNKGNRRRLAEALYGVSRLRLDLLPYYGRLAATIQPVMPDVTSELVDRLLGEFRFLLRKHPADRIESKVKNMRFIGELTKFRACDPKHPLSCLRTLLTVFRGHNIDMACQLLETCGRFLYRSPETHIRTKLLLEVMMKKKAALHLDERQNTIVANAFYYCNPPEHKAVPKKERPPLHDYLRHLLYMKLKTKASVVKFILEKLRKFPWDDHDMFLYGVKCFTRVWKLNFGNVQALASLLSGFSKYQKRLANAVVDAVLEDVRLGMEINRPELNQRRVSVCQYIAELYNYRMLTSKVVFNTLYSLIFFAAHHPTLDAPTNYFRIKLVCTILNGCGQFFDHGPDKRRLDCFLVYFQRYVLQKQAPLPIDVEFTLSDMLENLRPKLRRFRTLEEAQEAVAALETKYVAKFAQSHGLSVQDRMDQAHEAEMGEAEDDGDEDEDDEEDEEESEDSDDEETLELEEQPTTVKTRKPQTPEPEDDDFVEEFNRLLADTSTQRGGQATVSSLDVAIPMHLRGKAPTSVRDQADGSEKLVVTLLTKKKQQRLAVPSTAGMAERMLARQREEKHERDFNKQFVMEFDKRTTEEEEAMQAMGLTVAPDAPRASLPGSAQQRATTDKSSGRRRGPRGVAGPGARGANGDKDNEDDETWTGQPVFPSL